MCELEEFERLFDKVNRNNLGILLDLGHLKVASNLLNFNPDEFITKLKNKTLAIHVTDNNGRIDNHQSLKQESWALKVIDGYFKDAKIPIVLESICKNEKELQNNLNLLKRN